MGMQLSWVGWVSFIRVVEIIRGSLCWKTTLCEESEVGMKSGGMIKKPERSALST